MARRSATESAATLDILECLHLAPDDQIQAGKDLLCQVVSMLITMVRNIEGKGGEGKGKGRGRGKG